MMERRFLKGAQVRAKAGDKPGIEGYAAVFNEEYVLYEDTGMRMVETIAAGAFSDVLAQDVRCLFNHEPDNVLGRTTNKTLRLAEDDKGLSYDNDLDTRTTIAQNVQAFIERGDVTGCSFAFTVDQQSWRESQAQDGKMTIYSRVIEKIGMLYDVGPVTYPAYEATSVSPRSQEMRSRILSMEGLPAELRSRLMKRDADDGDGNEKCSCRCVACARDGNCDYCPDHMVDCGDSENCCGMRNDPAKAAAADADLDPTAELEQVDMRLRLAGLRTTA